MKNANKVILFSIIKFTVNHLGINPKKGGSPPNERKFKIKNILIILFLLKIELIWLI